MVNPDKPPRRILQLLVFLLVFSTVHRSLAHNLEMSNLGVMKGGRILMGIKETPNGGNVTFDCSPSGPCIPCSRSEKSDEKYRCFETGYRIRLKCAPSGPGSKEAAKSLKLQKKKTRTTLESTEKDVSQHSADVVISSTRQRKLGDSSKAEDGSRPYATYRSCIPAVNEERLSVLGFEALMMVLLLSSGSFVYFRRKRSNQAGGVPVRLPTSSRF